MRCFLLGLALLLFANLSKAQVTPDHVFNKWIYTVNLQGAGFKYYALDTTTKKVIIYNNNYSLLKEIHYSTEGTSGSIGGLSLSDHLLNSDDKIEMFYVTKDIDSSRYMVINEDGDTLFNKAAHYDDPVEFNHTGVSIIPGLPTLIAIPYEVDGGGQYFLPPTFSLYFLSDYIMHSSRIKFEVGGEKFAETDVNLPAYFYNPDGSYWKGIPIPFPSVCGGSSDYGYFYENYFSEHFFNSDDSLEGLYVNNACLSGIDSFAIVNENGTILLKGLGSPAYAFAGAPKLLIWDGTQTLVYSCPGLTLEHTFDSHVIMEDFDVSGPKFIKGGTSTFDLYNLDYSLWKTISSQLYFSGHRSEKYICPDDQLEGFRKTSGSDTFYSINEAGNKCILTTVTTAVTIGGLGLRFVDSLSVPKLPFYYVNGGTTETRIFNLPLCSPANVGTLSTENPFNIYPILLPRL